MKPWNHIIEPHHGTKSSIERTNERSESFPAKTPPRRQSTKLARAKTMTAAGAGAGGGATIRSGRVGFILGLAQSTMRVKKKNPPCSIQNPGGKILLLVVVLPILFMFPPPHPAYLYPHGYCRNNRSISQPRLFIPSRQDLFQFRPDIPPKTRETFVSSSRQK